MPKLYTYFGLEVFFYSNEHDPVHVHGQHGEQVSKAELTLQDGIVVSIRIVPVSRRAMLTGKPLKDFTLLVHARAQEIVNKWNDHFVSNQHIQPETITRRIKE